MENAEKMENMEMFSGSPLRCSPVLQLRCAPVIGQPCSGFRRTMLWFSVSRIITKEVEGSGICTILTRPTSINQMTQKCGRLLKEKSKLTCVDVLIKIFMACLLKEVKNSLFSFRHPYIRHLSRQFKKL